mmetsp:Transcript_31450/g.44640  ORF Transcript_31450/g.44640 Transcript_31450/m.44640 type:complete len:243 (-) Transcript_31450:39-767(-)|eukprot:CAMPEP_0202443690 /NCGR_PEP_ID=MMETSP1360-20130828/2880_1 /ASSEMBLY_ACC=CAM_ASM_000848 /TAXON_ID=515479 /ORGANISM="Licmophora paradoxa, Strain CCMP2313" /LENGTH=242 /DNA_ID=CAMNT_0049059429 /DNA_START=76 /DNA_END=804 /DNA_ORIENTATION=-
MTYTFEECPDGHHCENGSICTENEYDEGAYYCDCDEAIVNEAVAGLYCEHSATTYCTYNQEISRISFCTNDGTCNVIANAEEAHFGCDCPDNYEGDHCQFVKGSKPNGWPFDGSGQQMSSSIGFPDLKQERSTDEGLHAGIIVLIVLIVLGVVGAISYVAFKKQKSSVTLTKSASKIPEMSLEPDGDLLQQAVQHRGGVNNDAGDAMTEMDTSSSLPSGTGPMEDIQISDAHEDALSKPELV